MQITGKEPTSIKEPNKEPTPVIQVASFNLGSSVGGGNYIIKLLFYYSNIL